MLVTVDYGTAIPASSFNLSIVRTADNAVETFNNLSLNSADARYALDLVNGVSQIVQLSRSCPPPRSPPCPLAPRAAARWLIRQWG